MTYVLLVIILNHLNVERNYIFRNILFGQLNKRICVGLLMQYEQMSTRNAYIFVDNFERRRPLEKMLLRW
jgi:hypothetical protein